MTTQPGKPEYFQPGEPVAQQETPERERSLKERVIDIGPLADTAGLNFRGEVRIGENMSGLEVNPKDDWLYLAMLSLKDLASRSGEDIRSIANIGSGNGIETIAELSLFKNLERVTVTDIVPDILPTIQQNIEHNSQNPNKAIQFTYVTGRDCDPIQGRFDLIYANLPLIMVDDSDEFQQNRATTTLTQASSYRHLALGENDILYQYSLLSQLGFLESAKEKLEPNGRVITLLGGRVPREALNEVFRRAGFEAKELNCAFKVQADPEFLAQYAAYEEKMGAQFFFYDYERACQIIKEKFGLAMPDVVSDHSGEELQEAISSTRLTAAEAYAFSLEHKPVGHLAFSFEARMRSSDDLTNG